MAVSNERRRRADELVAQSMDKVGSLVERIAPLYDAAGPLGIEEIEALAEADYDCAADVYAFATFYGLADDAFSGLGSGSGERPFAKPELFSGKGPAGPAEAGWPRTHCMPLLFADPVPDDPADVAAYRAAGGYTALSRAARMAPEAIVAKLEAGGLRGKGGAGFPTGRKWRACLEAPGRFKHVVVNATEGDPGVFVDEALLRLRPHAVIEGACIAALAVGARDVTFYIRHDYAAAIEAVRSAVGQARAAQIIGPHALQHCCDIRVDVVHSGGRYVCGETSALLAGIEGGLPEARPDTGFHATERGLHDSPTVINNVETLAAVPQVLRLGPAAFAGIGVEGSTGTKLFSLRGRVQKPGLVELEFGTTLRELVYGIGGGMADGHAFKALLPGGPAESFIPESLLDTPIGFDEMRAAGLQLGSGGMFVLDEGDCVVDAVYRVLRFLADGSCGRCAPCREGLRQLLAMAARVRAGQGRAGDLDLMERICETMGDTALCALGRGVQNPVLSSLRYFADEWRAHVEDRRCPARVCPCGAGEEARA